MDRKDILSIDKWICKFEDPNSTGYNLGDDLEFADLCKDLGFELDNGQRLQERYRINSYDEVLRYLDRIDDFKGLGNALFSNWRYFNHGAYSVSEILDHREWFIKVLTRLKDFK